MEWVISCIIISYACFVIWLIVGWLSTPTYKVPSTYISTTKITVILPVRNEVENICYLLQDLINQNYPKSLYEIIVIDDYSSDGTWEILQNYHASNIKISRLSEKSQAPKKAAITYGVNAAQGTLIVCTDGDCRVGANWLKNIAAFYQTKQAHFISGAVTFLNKNTIFQSIQIVEFASLIGTGAASLYWQMPNMCNGANMAFSKEAFLQVEGYKGVETIPSGDDEFLMHKIAKAYSNSVFFIKDKETIVHTQACKNLKTFYYQRKRWASKWKFYQTWQPKFLAFYIFLVNLSCFIAFIAFLGKNYTQEIFWAQIGLKFLIEFVFLSLTLKFLGKARKIGWIPLIQILYPLYVGVFGILSFKKGYQWKGRKYKS